MSRITSSAVIIAIATFFATSQVEVAHGQMFGKRSLGATLRPQPRPGAAASTVTADATGEVEGSERFVRGNRSSRDFVGSDRREQSGFVGSQQALGTGRVVTATESLEAEADPTARINPPLPNLPPRAIYFPRLVLDPTSFSFSEANKKKDIQDQQRFEMIEGAIPLSSNEKFRVTAEQRVDRYSNGKVKLIRDGEKAILTGTVSNIAEAEQLQILLSFEPGIYQVENQLEIK